MLPNRSEDGWIQDYRLLKSQHPKIICFVVEGSTDRDLFKSLIGNEFVHIDSFPPPRNTSAKENVINIAMTAEQNSIQYVYGFVDLDYDDFLGKKKNCKQLLYTNETSIEIEFLKSKCYHAFMKETLTTEAFDTKQSDVKQILEIIRNECAKIGRMRIYANQTIADIDFKSLNYDDFLNEDNVLNTDKLIDFFIEKGWVSRYNKKGFKLFCEKISTDDNWKLCQGHDATTFLSILCKRKLLDYLDKDAERLLVRDGQTVEQHLRKLFSPSIFSETPLYKGVFMPILCNN